MQTIFKSISEWLSYWLTTDKLPKAEQVSFDRYYKSYIKHYGDYLKEHYNSQIQEAEQYVKDHVGCKVLEVGCGCGTESLWLAMQGAEVLAIDLQQNRLDVAKSRLEHVKNILKLNPKIEFYRSSLFDIDNEIKFNMIWMEQTFHHIEPREKLINKMRSMLQDGGLIIISDSNALNPFLQLQLFKQRGFKTIRKYVDCNNVEHLYGDERITTAKSLCKLLEKNRFEIVLSRHYRIFPNNKYCDSLAWIEKYIPSWLLPLFTHYNVVAKKI